MFSSQNSHDTPPFIVLCSVIAFHVICSACLLIDCIQP